MKVQKNQAARRFAALFCAMVMFVAGAGGCFAENAVDSSTLATGNCTDYQTITARFHEMISNTVRELPVEYSDEFFTREPDVFYLDLARASLGMAVSAFRNIYGAANEAEDANILSFFGQAGFENPESTWYDHHPTADSIATVIAQKKIGDSTVVALVCCGGGLCPVL